MGQTLLGGTSRGEDVSLLTPQQQSFLTQAGQGYSQMATPNMEELNQLFQRSYLDPALQAYERQIVPALQETLGESAASGALNRALASSASDIATGLGQQYGQFYTQQRLQGLQGLAGLAGQKTFTPTFETIQGILPSILQALGQVGAGYLGGI